MRSKSSEGEGGARHECLGPANRSLVNSNSHGWQRCLLRGFGGRRLWLVEYSTSKRKKRKENICRLPMGAANTLLLRAPSFSLFRGVLKLNSRPVGAHALKYFRGVLRAFQLSSFRFSVDFRSSVLAACCLLAGLWPLDFRSEGQF